MKYTQQQVKAALDEISRMTRDLLNSEEMMESMSFDERIGESIILTEFEQDIRLLLNEPWQELEKEIIFLETMIRNDPHADIEVQLKALKRQKSKRGALEEEGMRAYEKFEAYRMSH